MIIMSSRILIILSFILGCNFSQAWDKELAIGFLQTTGNSPSKSNNLRFLIKKNHKEYLYNLDISTFNQSKKKDNVAEKYKIIAKIDKEISNQKTFYILFLTEDDRFSGFDYQSSINFGYGRTLVEDNTKKLRVEFGPGYRVSAIPEQPKEREITFRIGEEYTLDLSKNADLKQSLSISSGEDNMIINFELGLSTSITDSLSLSLVYDSKYTDRVPIGRRNNDSKTSIQFNYAF